MHPMVIAGSALGAIVLLEWQGILPSSRESLAVPFTAGAAATAAGDYLRARKTIAGVAFAVPANNSPLQAFKAMRDAMVKVYGASGAVGAYPASMTYKQLLDVCDAWQAAWAAGHNAGDAAAQNFNLATRAGGMDEGGVWDQFGRGVDLARLSTVCSDPSQYGLTLTDLGEAMCALNSARAGIATLSDFGSALSTKIQDIFRAALAVAREMEAADFVSGSNVRASDQETYISKVPEAAGTAVAATGEFFAGAVTGLAGDLVLGIAKHPVLAAAVLGVVAWKVLL